MNPLRAALRGERLPAAALWLMAADGMSVYLRMMRRTLMDAGHAKADAQRIIAEMMARTWRRRWAVLRETHPHLPTGDAHIARFMGALYPTPGNRKTRWMFAALGDLPRGIGARARGLRISARFGPRARWDELATHLGELLIVCTQGLGDVGVSRGNHLLARMCHAAGQRYAALFRRRWALPDTAASAIEVLRIGEYIWQVNPEHESGAEGKRGYIDGNACRWYRQAGWQQVHCGIFGQFQNGVAAEFGMKYTLTRTIPRHGGDRCRIDLVAIGEPRAKSL